MELWAINCTNDYWNNVKKKKKKNRKKMKKKRKTRKNKTKEGGEKIIFFSRNYLKGMCM